ncbi:CYTH domain-containing protein [Phytoactinopolyspora endophytica]|uniref:CYTH domain-containing protein n=1 Tax=Phytoactinopolyspora endophytica TaxID=1642495 RepID=UPI0013EDCB14|nr:CYTH domain-containing protein [Phytoactinopolyspora endophytica]
MTQPPVEHQAEQKFRVHGLFRVPDLHNVEGVGSVDDLGSVELESAYFDTDDLRLTREGVTLRRRTGDDEGWHLKLPADLSTPDVRDEVRLPLTTGEDAAPDELAQIVRVIVRGSAVTRVSTLRTYRRRLRLHDAAGGAIADLVDDTVHVVGEDGTVTARFRELELEERAGGDALAVVAAALNSAGAVGGEFVAKVVRALGPAATSPPEIHVPRSLWHHDATGPGDPSRLALLVHAMRSADLTYRLDSEAASDALGRLADTADQLLDRISEPQEFIPADQVKALQAELSWLTGELKATAEPAGAPTRAPRALDSQRYLALHEALVSAVGAEHRWLTTV